MRYIILGSLLLKPMTIYDINKSFKSIISLFYSPSYGSINTTIKKLFIEKLISCKEEVISGRNKKVYNILEAGKKEFIHWMMSEINPNKLEVTALSKLFFLGFIEENGARIKIITDIVKTASSQKKKLEALKKKIVRSGHVPEEYEKVFFFQLRTLDYGLNSFQTSLKWFEKLLQELK